jgi:hypothetical protein
MSPLDQRQVYHLIERFAGQANVLTIPRLFIDWTGDHISALLLSQIIYWGSRTKDADGWFYKSAKEWEEELGISDYQLARATKKLQASGVITKLRKVQGAPTQHYRLDQDLFMNWISEKLGNGFPIPSEMDSPETPTSSYTETTDRDYPQRPFEISKGTTRFEKYDETRLALLPYAEDLARELNDQAPLTSTVTRLVNLYNGSGLDLETFLERLMQARAITQERTPAIRTPRADGWGAKPKMSYMLAVLEDLLGQSLPATGTAND